MLRVVVRVDPWGVAAVESPGLRSVVARVVRLERSEEVELAMDARPHRLGVGVASGAEAAEVWRREPWGRCAAWRIEGLAEAERGRGPDGVPAERGGDLVEVACMLAPVHEVRHSVYSGWTSSSACCGWRGCGDGGAVARAWWWACCSCWWWFVGGEVVRGVHAEVPQAARPVLGVWPGWWRVAGAGGGTLVEWFARSGLSVLGWGTGSWLMEVVVLAWHHAAPFHGKKEPYLGPSWGFLLRWPLCWGLPPSFRWCAALPARVPAVRGVRAVVAQAARPVLGAWPGWWRVAGAV